ncbi:hypothetical protein [Streptomyces pactum]|uniref:hypothetical protein n=1 Tax=Streptomyces pactum TaxID=68249 RepID=UPI0027DDA557|nr:hypothetical protein [Streptomyces pactum]
MSGAELPPGEPASGGLPPGESRSAGPSGPEGQPGPAVPSGPADSSAPAGPAAPEAEHHPGYDEFDDLDDLDEVLADRPGSRYAGARRIVIHAPYGNINTGSVRGGQRVENIGAAAGPGGRPVEAHEGPISALEILAAQSGFAEPAWFSAALSELATGVLFLFGEPGTGRRTAALNLLSRRTGGSMGLRALDSDVDLSTWRPTHTGTRGYLVHGLLPHHPLGPAVLANLRRLLGDADACMVIVLPDDPELVRGLARDLHVSPVRCVPPPPRAVFDALFTTAVPDRAERARLLGRLEPGLLDDVLAAELVPAQVVELVAAVREEGEDGPDAAGLRDRLSFGAEEAAPDLVKGLREDPDGLAFLLATCVFEGLDHRIVQEEAERLLAVADGRLDSVLRDGGADGDQGPAPRRDTPRPNPRFVFRRSLDELMRKVGARSGPREIRTGSRYGYAVEPVRFTRHRQGEAVLKHVWRQYGQLPGLLTDWLNAVSGREPELAEPVGRVMGMAAGWGGGRRALRHIRELADSERPTSRTIAAHALGMAAEDPVLAGEVKYRLRDWSRSTSWRLRWTVAYACRTDFGISRPELALGLLRGAYRGRDGEEYTVDRTVRHSLLALFAAGAPEAVFTCLAAWADRDEDGAELALGTLPLLLRRPLWFRENLLTVGENTARIVELVRRALNDDTFSDAMRGALLTWFRIATGDETERAAVETLVTVLAQEMRYGELGLFVEMDREGSADLAGRHIARYALDDWRNGVSPRSGSSYPDGRTR